MDDAGNAVDFVAWGYTDEAAQGFDVKINGHAFTIDNVWIGSPVVPAGNRDNSLQRFGELDRGSAIDGSKVVICCHAGAISSPKMSTRSPASALDNAAWIASSSGGMTWIWSAGTPCSSRLSRAPARNREQNRKAVALLGYVNVARRPAVDSGLLRA